MFAAAKKGPVKLNVWSFPDEVPGMIEKYLNPTISIIFAPASLPAKAFPSIGTSIIVNTVTIALPTPALVRASVVRFSRSLPPLVKAGIMDQ